MLRELINHSPDLQFLWNEGYEMEVKDGFLLMHNVPYVNQIKKVNYGTLVSPLDLAGNKTTPPKNHVLHFTGEMPCHKDGKQMSNILNSSSKKKLTESITIDHTFSSKPHGTGKYANYYEKMSTYANIISAPAKALDSSVTEKTFEVYEMQEDESVFNYMDTNSTRAEISSISDKLKGYSIAIIGLGGTGSYILDFLAKTPVDEIHLFDKDYMLNHNAFRSPGAPSIDELKKRQRKVDYHKGNYSDMHRKIIPHPYNIDDSNVEELRKRDFVFLSIDNGGAKGPIVSFLENNNIPFIDVGMGVNIVDSKLIGTIRVTTNTEAKRNHFRKKVSLANGEDDAYNQNIQIAELNALNASLAVIKWKKFLGFYQDLENEHNSTYDTNVNMLLSDDFKA